MFFPIAAGSDILFYSDLILYSGVAHCSYWQQAEKPEITYRIYFAVIHRFLLLFLRKYQSDAEEYYRTSAEFWRKDERHGISAVSYGNGFGGQFEIPVHFCRYDCGNVCYRVSDSETEFFKAGYGKPGSCKGKICGEKMESIFGGAGIASKGIAPVFPEYELYAELWYWYGIYGNRCRCGFSESRYTVGNYGAVSGE